ncbi:unnamed protein product [Prorocentrum cordatum]|uniref:Uncharacterized protein n=1 Tax=Prorocentrum cordatum TaxID=2364126 RepID=A0ABN9X7J4_9DINO|nr:unnamed protein product [Polarella glacialis]
MPTVTGAEVVAAEAHTEKAVQSEDAAVGVGGVQSKEAAVEVGDCASAEGVAQSEEVVIEASAVERMQAELDRLRGESDQLQAMIVRGDGCSGAGSSDAVVGGRAKAECGGRLFDVTVTAVFENSVRVKWDYDESECEVSKYTSWLKANSVRASTRHQVRVLPPEAFHGSASSCVAVGATTQADYEGRAFDVTITEVFETSVRVKWDYDQSVSEEPIDAIRFKVDLVRASAAPRAPVTLPEVLHGREPGHRACGPAERLSVGGFKMDDEECQHAERWTRADSR